MLSYENVTQSDAERAVRLYNEGFYAKGGAKNVEVDRRARQIFADGLGATVERITTQLRFVGKNYGGVAGFPAALTLAPSIAKDIHAGRAGYLESITTLRPLRDEVASRPTLDFLYTPFVKELHGKRNWLTWATKFWHFLNVDAFPMADSTVDRFFHLHNQSVSLDKYEKLLSRYRSFIGEREDWLPPLRAADGGLAWSDVKLWDKVCYGVADINRVASLAR